MACSDSDSDREYPLRWMDRNNYLVDGKILILIDKL